MTSEPKGDRSSLLNSPVLTKLVCNEAELRDHTAMLVLRNPTERTVHQFDLPTEGRKGQLWRMIAASAHLAPHEVTVDKLTGLTLRLMLCPADGAIVDLAVHNPTVKRSYVLNWPHHFNRSVLSSTWTQCGECVDRLLPAQLMGPTRVHSTGTGSADQIDVATGGPEGWDAAWNRFDDVAPRRGPSDTIVLKRSRGWRRSRFWVPWYGVTFEQE